MIRKLLKWGAVIVFIESAFYAAIAVANKTFNCKSWQEDWLTAFAIMSIIVTVFSGVALNMILTDKKVTDIEDPTDFFK